MFILSISKKKTFVNCSLNFVPYNKMKNTEYEFTDNFKTDIITSNTTITKELN